MSVYFAFIFSSTKGTLRQALLTFLDSILDCVWLVFGTVSVAVDGPCEKLLLKLKVPTHTTHIPPHPRK